MAEVEYAGVKMSGSKLLIILPLLGQPEVIEQEIVRLTELTEVIKDNLQGEITEASRLARRVEGESAKTQREVRDDVYEMEREMQERFKEQDKEMREMRKELEERIQTILENPLNDVE
jgi:tryptophanyl-tRNA synthetase